MSHKIDTADHYLDLLLALDDFLCEQGHAWGLTYSGTGDGRLVDYIGTPDSVVETITIEATDSVTFTVVGSVSGSLGSATVGLPFTSAVIEFTIEAGDVAFEAGDTFTLNTSPPWERLRLGGCPDADFRSATFSSLGNLFDGNAGTFITTTTFPAAVTLEMLVPTEVRAFHITCSSTQGRAPRDFALEYSDDGESWTTAEDWEDQTWTMQQQRRDFVLETPPGEHLYWRLSITEGNNATLEVSELALYADELMKWSVSNRVEFGWKAPGVDGAQSIYVAGYTDTDAAGDRYNLVFRGFRHWLDADQSVLDVPNSTGDKVLLLNKTPVGYWAVAHGGRLILATRLSGRYQWAYAGFGLPYESPTDHPFPYVLAAACPLVTARWNDATTNLYTNPDHPVISTSPTTNASMACIHPDGRLVQVSNLTQGGFDSGASGRAKVWPSSGDTTGAVYPTHLREAIDGSRPLLPLVIFDPNSPVHVWGELDGAYFVPSFGASAEALVRRGAIDHLLIPNVTRSDRFAAIALD